MTNSGKQALKSTIFQGLGWTLSSQVGRQATQFVCMMILARLLTPGDFGLIGMALVFTGLVSALCQVGVSGAVVQKQNLDEGHFSTLFWLNVFVGGALTCASWWVAPWLARFYNEVALTAIIQVLGINFVLGSIGIIQQAIFQKELVFQKIAFIEIFASLVSGGVAILLAFSGRGVWSLVCQQLLFTGINSALLFISSTWRPKAFFSLDKLRDVFSFSMHVTGFSFVSYLARNVDYLIVGKFIGAEALGFYTLAYKLMIYPLQNISWVFSKVMFPAFSKMQNDLERVRRTFLKMNQAIAIICFPMMCFLFLFANELIDFIYGQAWLPAIPLIKVMCFCGILQSVSTTAGLIFMSQGKVKFQLFLALGSTALLVGFIFLGLRWGIFGVAICYLIYTVIMAHISLFSACHMISLQFPKYYLAVAKVFLMNASLFGAIALFREVFKIDSLVMPVCFSLLGLILYFWMIKKTVISLGIFPIRQPNPIPS